jgi:hypothetical protein
MKKIYFLAAIAALVLGSCTSEEVLNQPSGVEDEPSAICFSTFLDRAPQNGVRPLSVVMDADGLRGVGFTILAYSTGTAVWAAASATAPAEPNFMNNQAVEWIEDLGAWTYTPTKNWPKINDSEEWTKVTFFGVSTVSGATATGVAGGNPQIYFETAAEAGDQVDLAATILKDVTKAGNSGTANFKFDHILSQIGFKVRLANVYEAATVTVTSLKVYYAAGKVNSSGTYTFADDILADTNWDLTGAATFPNAATGSGDLIFTGASEALTSGTTLTPPDKYLMLIPQTLAEGDIYVELAYTVKTGEGANGSVDSSVTIPLPQRNLETGKRYPYTLGISLDAVEFDETIDVDDWSYEGQDIPV